MSNQAMSARELARIGRRLYGHDWQSPLARKIKKHRITVWRWLAKKVEIPEDAAAEIRSLDARRKK